MGEDRYRACPKGMKRGVDVARMYPEIEAIVRAKFGRSGLDLDDLVQEAALAITRRNDSAASAFDPKKASFGHYVYMVADNVAGHLRGSQVRRDHQPIAVEASALEALPHEAQREAAPLEASAATVGELVEQLVDEAARARGLARESRRRRDEHRARYQEGAADGLQAVAELLSSSFGEEALAPLPRRVLAVLSVAGAPLSPGQLSAALLVPMDAVARAIERLGDRLAERDGRVVLAPLDAGARPSRKPREVRSSPRATLASAPSPALWAAVSRTLTRALSSLRARS